MEARKLSTLPLRPFQLSLGIRHPSMDPAEISRELRLEPDDSFRAGEPRQSRSGLGSTTRHAETYWLGTLNPADWRETLSIPENPGAGRSAAFLADDGIANVLDLALGASAFFLRAHATFFQRIQSEGAQVRLLVALEPKAVRSFTITPATSRVLNELGVTIEFEFTNR
jgi:hypothetical protein